MKIFSESNEDFGIARKNVVSWFFGAFFCLSFLMARHTVAATWYVDSAATGVANGKNWTDAWKDPSLIPWGSVASGDTVYISGGPSASSKTYTKIWKVGTAGVRVALEASNPAHNGKVIFDFEMGDRATVTGLFIDRTGVTIDGEVNGESRMEFRNLRNIMDRSMGYCMGGWNANDLWVKWITFSNVNHGLRFSSTDRAKVHNCKFFKVRGDAAVTVLGAAQSWDQILVYSNYINIVYNQAQPEGAAWAYSGPDGVQGGSGMSIFRNTFHALKTTDYTSSQHPDFAQVTGNYLKFYENEIINIGDSAFDYDSWNNPNPHDVLVYNNVFRIEQDVDNFPDFFRFYNTGAPLQSIRNFKIFNNTFLDNPRWTPVHFRNFNGNPTASGIEIKNNIFYNVCETQFYPAVIIDKSDNFTPDSFQFSCNNYFAGSRTLYMTLFGTNYTFANWKAKIEPSATSTGVVFRAYAAKGANDAMLAAKTPPGESLQTFFSTDKTGFTRSTNNWDIGAMQFRLMPPTALRVVGQ